MRPDETTALLSAAREGERQAVDRLFVHVYEELRRLSQRRLGAEPDVITLSTTDLIHEAYLKLIEGRDWSDRTHFFAIAARAMRQILTDRARARNRLKRGGPARPVTLHDEWMAGEGTPIERILAVDAALDRLATRDADMARLVELRFFGGLEVEEAADVLAVSPRTAARLWARAKAHLRADLA